MQMVVICPSIFTFRSTSSLLQVSTSAFSKVCCDAMSLLISEQRFLGDFKKPLPGTVIG